MPEIMTVAFQVTMWVLLILCGAHLFLGGILYAITGRHPFNMNYGGSLGWLVFAISMLLVL
jgi:hypothetical protein